MNSKYYNTPFELFTVGFDDFLKEMKKPVENNYPPYNILKTGEKSFLIEMAVAGFSEDEVDVLMDNGVLIVRGSQNETGDMDIDIIHKGISTRDFERKFTLANDVEVKSADLYNGLLRISVRAKDVGETYQKIPLNSKKAAKSVKKQLNG